MTRAENVVRLLFSVLACLLSVTFTYGYHWVFYHNYTDHAPQSNLGAPADCIMAVAPWTFLAPPLMLVAGILLRKRPAAFTAAVNLGWLIAVTWPPLVLWVWNRPNLLM